MNEPKTQQEPSMEEILASIRRIISEDADKDGDVEMQTAPNGAPSTDKPEAVEESSQPDALEAEAEPEPDPEPAPDPVTEPEPEPAEEEVLELTEIVEDAPSAMAAPEPRPALRSEPDRRADGEDGRDRLVSDDTADAAREAFARLIRESAPDDRPAERAAYVGDGQLTIEDLVRAELRPILRDWLDKHLHDVVDEIVRREVEHIVHSIARR